MCYMESRTGEVGVRELRQNLSVYLRRIKAGETLDVKARGERVAILAPASARSTILDRLITTGRATPAVGDLLDLGTPSGRRPARRASRALAHLRQDSP